MVNRGLKSLKEISAYTIEHQDQTIAKILEKNKNPVYENRDVTISDIVDTGNSFNELVTYWENKFNN